MLDELGIRPSKKLGQNFLVDGNTNRYILNTIDPRNGETILEIGPGLGSLIDYLVERGSRIIAIEYDARLAEYLQSKFAGNTSVSIIQGDACRITFDDLVGGKPYSCVGNLPYSISSLVIARLLECDNRPAKMHFTLQKEMAERITSKPGCKAYGSLSIRVQALYETTIKKIISPTVFFPRPKVESAFLHFKLKEQLPKLDVFECFTRIVKQAFLHRRKKLYSTLSSLVESNQLQSLFEQTNLSFDVRPDSVPVEVYLSLAENLSSKSKRHL